MYEMYALSTINMKAIHPFLTLLVLFVFCVEDES